MTSSARVFALVVGIASLAAWFAPPAGATLPPTKDPSVTCVGPSSPYKWIVEGSVVRDSQLCSGYRSYEGGYAPAGNFYNFGATVSGLQLRVSTYSKAGGTRTSTYLSPTFSLAYGHYHAYYDSKYFVANGTYVCTQLIVSGHNHGSPVCKTAHPY